MIYSSIFAIVVVVVIVDTVFELFGASKDLIRDLQNM